jgi:hypothetical protein
MYGGLSHNFANNKVQASTDLYVLDFSEATPRWRRATVDNMLVEGAFQLSFPNTGIATLPDIAAVALMNRQVITWQVVGFQRFQAAGSYVQNAYVCACGSCWSNKLMAPIEAELTPSTSSRQQCHAVTAQVGCICNIHVVK